MVRSVTRQHFTIRNLANSYRLAEVLQSLEDNTIQETIQKYPFTMTFYQQALLRIVAKNIQL